MSTFDMDTWCVGPCMNGARRRVRDHQAAIERYHAEHAHWRDAGGDEPEPPEPPRIYPTYGEPIYCPSCTFDVKAKLSRLDGAACVYLRESDGMRGQTDQAKVSVSNEDYSLSPTIEDLDEFERWLRDWRAAWLDSDMMARQGQLADSITLGTSWLVARTERILAHADLARPFGDEVNAWYSRMRRYDPSEIVVERLHGIRCPACSCFTLERRVGEEKVTCRMPACDRILTIAEYQALEEDARTARKAS